MEPRLLPINALIALSTPGDMNPSPLADAGFRIAAFEVPIGLDPEKVVVDVVLWHGETALLVAIEGKSGANVDKAQAAKYSHLDAQNVVHASSVDLQAGTRPSVSVLYAVLEENVARIRLGLTNAKLPAPVLGVANDAVRLHDPHIAHPLLRAALGDGEELRLPWGIPRLVPCDHQSSIDVVLPQVKAVLVAHSSRRTVEASAEMVAVETLPHLLKYGRGARQRFVKTVADCVRRIATEHPEIYEFRAATANHDPLVRFLKTPEDNDNRGRTQAYQALARGSRHRRPVVQNPDQLDLIWELGEGENVSGVDEDRESEEEQR